MGLFDNDTKSAKPRTVSFTADEAKHFNADTKLFTARLSEISALPKSDRESALKKLLSGAMSFAMIAEAIIMLSQNASDSDVVEKVSGLVDMLNDAADTVSATGVLRDPSGDPAPSGKFFNSPNKGEA